MYSFLIAIYVLICLGLIFFVLIQSGRGGGLVESFSSAETIFGTKTNKYLVRITGVLTALFFVLTIFIAFLSKQRTKSLMEIYKPSDTIKKEESAAVKKEAAPTQDQAVKKQEPKTDESKKETIPTPSAPNQ